MCVGDSVWYGWRGTRVAGWSLSTPTQPHRNSNTHRTKNNTTNVAIQQNSHKLLMMDIMSETCWAHKKWNKIASDIKLVFYSSTLCLFYSHKLERLWKREFVVQSKSSAGYFLRQICKTTDDAAVSTNGFPADIRTPHPKNTTPQLTASWTYPVRRYYVSFLFSRLSGRSSRPLAQTEIPFISLPSNLSKLNVKTCLPECHKMRRCAHPAVLYHFSAIK